MTVSSWKTVWLRDLLSGPIKNGYSPNCVDEPTGKWVLGLGALDGRGLNIKEIKAVPMGNKKVTPYILKEGDFLVSRSNTLDKVGRAALFRGEIENCSYPDLMMRFRINEKDVYPDFLDEYLRSELAQRYFRRCAAGTSLSMVKITKTTLEKLKIYLPPKTQQIKIANIARYLTNQIEKTELLISAKERQFGWLVKRIYKNLELTKENKTTLSCHLHATSHIHGDKNAIIASVGKKGIRNRSEVYSKSLSNDYSKNKLVYKDEIAFGLANDRIVYGVNLSQEIFSVSSAYKTFKILGCDSRFLKYLLDTNNSKLSLKYLITSARQGKSVDFDGFLKEKFVFPEISKQKHISNTINTAQQEITLLKNLARQYRTQKRGLMQKLLSGEWQLNPKEENHEKR
jgi:type I restriction enzyme S subunit